MHRKMGMMKFELLVLLILISVGKWCCEGCWKEERDGLLRLKALFDYPQDFAGWVDGTDCCQWKGVECNITTGRVAELYLGNIWGFDTGGYHWYINFSDFRVFEDLESLYLDGNNIDGCSQNLGSWELKNLRVLDLSYNYLNDTGILSCLSGLPSLDSLDLSGNQLTGKSVYGFSRLKNLRALDLSSNLIDQLTGKSRSWELKNLQVLYLSYNYLNDTNIQSYMSGLPSLKFLYLSENQLTAYGSSRLKNLRVLDWSFNHLDQLTGNYLACLYIEKLQWPKNLEELDLSGNYLKNDIVLSFTELHCLKSIDLSNNSLEGSLNITGLNALTKLETLILSENNITKLSVPQGFSWPTNLEFLQLSINNFSNDIVSSLSGLRNLKSLDLSGNHLEGFLDISGLNALSKLKTLILSGNNIIKLSVPQGGNQSLGLSLQGFSWPTSLEDLQLDGNNVSIDIISSLSGLRNLKSLDLSDNHLEGFLDISGLNALSKLETLDLSGNNIVNLGVHQGTKNLSSIKDLRLFGNNINGSMLRESLHAFSSIRRLDLSYYMFNGTIVAEDFGDLNNLEELVLDSSSNIGIEFFKTIGALNSLKVLSMVDSGINGTLPEADWSKLNKLKKLDLSFNKFEGPLPSSFSNMTSLQYLDLSDNYFIGNIASTLTSLTSLESLHFEENQFEVPVSFTSLANHSYIKSIYGGGNKLVLDPDSTTQPWIPKFQLQELDLSFTTQNHSLPLPNFLFYQYNLTLVDFEGWKLDEEFPSWLLGNNTKMTYLILSNCSIIGHLQLPSHPNIEVIDVSDNSIIGTIISKNNSSILPNLVSLNMARNKIHGSFSIELGQSKFLERVDLSNNYFFGKIPHSLFYTPIMRLDIGSNNFSGKLPKSIANASYLSELYMDNNHFEDSIPIEFVEHRTLHYLDLSGNKLSGFIPSLVNASIAFIYLSNNRLRGFSTRMFNEKSSLVLLDLSYNEIAGNLQDLINNCTKLKILLLKGNYFAGQISEQLCQLTNLTMIDLSYNLISGPIPKCLGKVNFGVKDIDLSPDLNRLYGGQYDFWRVDAKADFTTKGISYTYEQTILELMAGMDLSQNKLDGNIPHELGNLTKIRAINMSYNCLTGEIPATFSNLKQIESLDLSFNRLSGTIPPQLIELTSLEVFSVAYNNISGPTPDRDAQFLTFDESSYEGNPFLCGPPLPRSCTDRTEDPSTFVPNALNGEGDNDGLDMQVFYVSFAVAYMMVLLVMAIVLYINPYWRQTWFYFIELVIRNCYYFFVDLFYKLPTVRNM